MARKAIGGTTLRRPHWKRRIMIIASALIVVCACIALRKYSGPQDVQAQAPRQQLAPLASSHVSQTPTTSSTVASSAAPIKVVASVNTEQITRQDLADECLKRYGQEVLESLVNKHLIWQACQDLGITITDEHVEAEIGRLASKFGLAAGRWLSMLQEERGITPEQYRKEIIWPTLALRALAAKEIEVTPQELQRAFEAEYGPRVKARAITVSTLEKAEQLRAEAIKSPDTFGALAKQYSEDQSASVHGLIPPIRKHMGDENIERVAFSMQEGEISPVLQVAHQYVILMCEKHMPETYIAERFRADAEARIRDRVEDQKMRSAAANLFQRLQQDAQVVNVINNPQLRSQMPGVAATINGQKVAVQQLAEECIQRHGNEVLESEINRKILLQALGKKGQQVTEQMLDAEIARAADSYGFLKPNGTPDIESWLAEVTKEEGSTVELYVRDAVWPTVALKTLVGGRVQVTEQDLQKGFESNYGPRVEVLAIVLSNHRQAQKVWEMARGNPTDEFFGELAHQYSVDAVSRENFGKIPPIRRHGGRPELEKEAFALKPGELSGIIASDESYVILRCNGQTKPIVANLDSEVRGELLKDIHEKKLRVAMAVEFDRLLESAAIENYLAGTFQSPAQNAAPKSAGAGSPTRR